MPMVETSVAVATPSITAARMTNGKAMAGSAMTKARPISRAEDFVTCDRSSLRLRRQTAPRVPPQTPPARAPADHDPRQQPAGEQRGNGYAGHRAHRDQHETRRN